MRAYKLVTVGTGLTELERVVNEHCARGWEPQGSPFFHAPSAQWAQAMTREESNAKPGEVSLREPKGGN